MSAATRAWRSSGDDDLGHCMSVSEASFSELASELLGGVPGAGTEQRKEAWAPSGGVRDPAAPRTKAGSEVPRPCGAPSLGS